MYVCMHVHILYVHTYVYAQMYLFMYVVIDTIFVQSRNTYQYFQVFQAQANTSRKTSGWYSQQ